MIIGIDADIVVYRAAFAAQKSTEGVVLVEPVDKAIMNCRSIIGRIFETLETRDHICYLTANNDPTNYRIQYGKEYSNSPGRPKGYKAHRAATPKPVHYQACRDFIMDTYTCDLAIGEEADDRMGIDMSRDNIQCIASLDKDLDMIPGMHYNWVRGSKVNKDTMRGLGVLYGKEPYVPNTIEVLSKPRESGIYTITPIDGLRNFYKQFLIGDAADNIPGITGLGPVKAGKLIDPLTTERQMFEAVQVAYNDDKKLLDIGRCLKIRTFEGELWEFPE
jgi:hypothetical protein